jgi:hypothetical protein
MESSFWVKIKAQKKPYGWVGNGITASKNKPSTDRDEIAFQVNVAIPDAYFETPSLSVDIIVPDEAVNKPIITPKLRNNLAQAICDQIGFKAHVTIDVAKEGEA